MDVPNDPDELRNWMMERWHQYGETFTVFTPAEQPAPDIWEPELPGYDNNFGALAIPFQRLLTICNKA